MEKIKVLKKRPKNGHFPIGVSPWILSKNRNFSYGRFLQKLCQKKSFLNISNRKQSFLDQKIEVLTRTKKWTFFKGLSPRILSKNRTFSYLSFFTEILKENNFFDIVKRKE